MKRILRLTGCALIATALLSASCKKNDTSDLVTPEVSFGITSDNPLTNLTATASKGFSVNGIASMNWTAGTANITGFKLEAKKNNKEVEITSKNITNVNLFALSPSMVSATIDTGTYKEIEIKVLLTKSSTTDLPLVLKGTYTTAGGAAIPVEFDFNDNAIIKAEAENVVVDGTKDIRTTLSMHLNKLLLGITSQEIDSAPRTNGTLIVSSTINTNLYNKVKLNLTSCGGSKGFEKHDIGERKKV